jgi:hypothetical protein
MQYLEKHYNIFHNIHWLTDWLRLTDWLIFMKSFNLYIFQNAYLFYQFWWKNIPNEICWQKLVKDKKLKYFAKNLVKQVCVCVCVCVLIVLTSIWKSDHWEGCIFRQTLAKYVPKMACGSSDTDTVVGGVVGLVGTNLLSSSMNVSCMSVVGSDCVVSFPFGTFPFPLGVWVFPLELVGVCLSPDGVGRSSSRSMVGSSSVLGRNCNRKLNILDNIRSMFQHIPAWLPVCRSSIFLCFPTTLAQTYPFAPQSSHWSKFLPTNQIAEYPHSAIRLVNSSSN